MLKFGWLVNEEHLICEWNILACLAIGAPTV